MSMTNQSSQSGGLNMDLFTRSSKSNSEATAQLNSRLEWLVNKVPELGENPQVALDLASSTMSDAELYQAAIGSVEGAQWRQSVDYLKGQDINRQRAMWDTMPVERQRKYAELGYVAPTAEQLAGRSDSWMAPVSNAFGTAMGGVGMGFTKGMEWLGNVTDTTAERPSRAIDRMDGAEQLALQLGLQTRDARQQLTDAGIDQSPDQWTKLYWLYAERNPHSFQSLGGTSDLPGPLGVAANMADPRAGVTYKNYNPFEPVGGVEVDEELYKRFEQKMYELDKKPEYEAGFMANWGEVADGMEYISPSQQITIQNKLNRVPDEAYHFAMWNGQGKTTEEWIQTREGLDPATEQGRARIAEIENTYLASPDFVEARDLAAKYAGSTTAGTSFAQALGISEGQTGVSGQMFTGVSGATDALFQLTLDPTLAAGKGLKGYKAMKWAVEAGDAGLFTRGVARAQRLGQMAENGRVFGSKAIAPSMLGDDAVRVSRGTSVQRILGDHGEGLGTIGDLFDESGEATKFLTDNYDALDTALSNALDTHIADAMKVTKPGARAKILSDAADARILRDVLADTIVPLEKRSGLKGAVDSMHLRAAISQRRSATMIADTFVAMKSGGDDAANALPSLLQKMPHMTDGIDGLMQWDNLLTSWRGGKGIESADDVFDFYKSHLGAMKLLGGRLTPTYLSANLIELPRFTRRNSVGRGVSKFFTDGMDWAGELGQDAGWLANNLSRPVRGAGKFFEGLTRHTPRNTAIQMMQDGSTWLDISNESAVGEFMRMTEFGRFMGNRSMKTADINRYVTDFVLGGMGENAANMSTRRNVIKNYMMDLFDRAGVREANPDIQRWADDFIERFDSQAYGPLGIDELPIGDMNMRSPIFPDSQFSPLIEIPSFRDVATATRKTGFVAKAMRGVNNPFIDAAMSQAWKPAMLLRAGFIPRAAGEEMLSWIARHGLMSLDTRLAVAGASERGTTVGKLLALPGEIAGKALGNAPNEIFRYRTAMKYKAIADDAVANTGRIRTKDYWQKLQNAASETYEFEPNWADKFGMMSDWLAGSVSSRLKTGYFRLASSEMQTAAAIGVRGGMSGHANEAAVVVDALNLEKWIETERDIAQTTKRMLRSISGVDSALAQVSAHHHFLMEPVDEVPTVTGVLKGFTRDGGPMDVRMAPRGGYHDVDIDDVNDLAANGATYEAVRLARESVVGQAAMAELAGVMPPDKLQELGMVFDLPPGVPDDQIATFTNAHLGGPLVRRSPEGNAMDISGIADDWARGTSLLEGPEATALTGIGIDPAKLVGALGDERRYEQFLVTRERIAARRAMPTIKPGMEAQPDAILQNQRLTRAALDEMGIEWADVAAQKASPANLAEVRVDRHATHQPAPKEASTIGRNEPLADDEYVPFMHGGEITYRQAADDFDDAVAEYWGSDPVEAGITDNGFQQMTIMDPAVEEGRREATVTTFVYADDSGPLGMLVLDHTKQEIHWIRSHPDATGGVAQLLEDAARKKLGGAYEAYRTNSDLTIQGRQFGLRNQARERLTGRPIEEAESIRDVLRRGAAGEDVADSEIDDVLAAMGRAPRDGEMPRDVFTDRAEQWHAGASGSRSVDETGALRSEEQIVSSDLFQMSDEDLGAIADAYGVERGTRDEMLDALHARVGEDIPLTDDWAEPFDPASRFTSPERTQAFLEQHRQRIATDRKWQNQLRGIVQDVRSTPSGKAPFSKAEIEDLMATFPAEKYPVTERYLRSTHPGSNLENAAFTTTNKGKVVLASEEHLDDLEMTLRLIGSNRSAAHVILSDSPIRIGRSEDFLDSAETAAHKRLGEPDIEHFVRNQDRYNFVDGRPVNNPLPEYMRSYYSTMMETSTVDNLMAMRDEQGSQALLNQLTQHGLAGDDYAVVAQMLDELDVGVQGSFVRSAAKDRRYVPFTHLAFGNYDDAERITGIFNRWHQATNGVPGNVAEVGYRQLPDAKMWSSKEAARNATLPADDLPLSTYRTEEWVQSGMRPFMTNERVRYNAAGEITEDGEHVLDLATREEAIKRGATPVRQYIEQMFTRNGEVVHELLEPAINGNFTMQTPRMVDHDRLPKHVIGRTELSHDPGWWQKAIRKGFDGYIAPAVSALIRNPMMVLSMSEGLKGAQLIDDMLRSPRLMDAGMGAAKTVGFDDMDHLRDLWWGIDDWKRTQIDDGASFREAIKSLNTTGPDGLTDLAQLNDVDLGQVAAMLAHDEYVENAVVHTAMGRAVRDTVPYIDDHNVRSFFQEYARNLMPFQFAQEQFLKRWARTVMYDPAAVERMRLLVGGFTQSALVHENERGEKAFYIPMTEQLGWIMANVPVVNALWGQAAEVPISVPLSGEVSSTLPGIPGDFQRLPSLGPVAAIPTQAIRDQFPEMRPLFDAALGSEGDRDVLSQLFPAWMTRSLAAVTNGGLGMEQELNASTVGALQQMKAEADRLRIQADAAEEEGRFDEASGMRSQADTLDLPDTATPREVEIWLDQVKSWSRSNMATRAVVGFFSPAPPKTDFEDAKLAPEFTALLEHHSIEEALAIFMTSHPEGTAYTVFQTEKPSGAPLPATDAASEWLTTNRAWSEQFPLAAPWMLPQVREGDEFNRHAYNDMLAQEMRRRKAPEEWYDDLKFAGAARNYFDGKDTYNANRLALEASGDRAAIQRLDLEWKSWSTAYRNRHPLFASQLTGETRTKRIDALKELQLAMNDPERPAFEHEAETETVLASYDAFVKAEQPLRTDTRDEAREARERLKQQFSDWGERFIVAHPEMSTMWRTLIEPAADLRDDRVARNLVLQQMNGAR